MSRIHEALKRAEQERALAGPVQLDTTSVLDRPTEAGEIIANAAALAGGVPTPGFSAEAVLTRSRTVSWNPDPKTMLFFSGEEHSPGKEQFRTLRSRLYQAREKQPLSKLMVTSALPKEGKSFTTANLGQVIVRQHGRRALLIDADLRNPQLHRVLGAEPGPGLSEYLQGLVDEYSILQRGSMDNLFLIPGGQIVANPAELLAGGRMKFLLNSLQSVFDWIIIDTPPAVPVADASMIANLVDGVLLVVRSNSTPIDAARRARNEFLERNVVGVVLNGVTPDVSPYVQYYYASYSPEARTGVKN
ncbi:MAG: CpsD/CapB family tyrosine-protein kinase [Acidobacteria bacterium]|nr:CpsD/CapB family tyrosine-protein kinase [Acidobacteriota bacterium]